tara:strand:- start:28660 stop:28911 length:252 start_codon:yes stop_codon:yes gene_type:complete
MSRQFIKDRIENKRYVEFKSLSICKINDFYDRMVQKDMYQVHCSNPKCLQQKESTSKKIPFSMLYEDIEQALNKFIELRKKIR